jgi:hypothetical protein
MPEYGLLYTLTFLSENPYMEKYRKRVRSRYVYNSMQFSADDCYAGNILRNPSFEEWTANTSLIWTTRTAVEENEWRCVRYSPELDQYCAVAATGTNGTKIMISPNGQTWSIPSGLPSNADNQWRGLTWCPDWGLWLACSITGTQNRCAVSADGNAWTAKTTPAGADSNSWGYALWIPPDDTLTTGRALLIAYAGGNSRIMYTDDQGGNWTQIAASGNPADSSDARNSNNWLSAAYNPDTHRIVVVAYGGSATQRVMISDNYGATWTAINSPAQKWTSVVWADTLGLYIACSEDGTQQVMTSPDGETWTLKDTPYTSSSTTTTGGQLIESIANQTEQGWNYTTLTNDYNSSVNPMAIWELPALSGGHIYRIDNVHCELRAVSSGPTASIIATYQVGTGPETTIKEWTETSTTYQPKTLSVAIETATNETVKIRFRLKTSNTSIRAGATLMGFTASELDGPAGSQVTYERLELRAITWAKPVGLLVAVAQDATENRLIYSTDAINWQLSAPSTALGWVSLCYSREQLRFVAVGTSGSGRVMESDSYGTFKNVAPANWTYYTSGQERGSEHVTDGAHSLKIIGNGITVSPGEVYQTLNFDSLLDSGVRYVLSAQGMVEGLTQGSFKVALMAGASIIKELIWDADTDWTPKQIYFRFDTIPTSVTLRVMGSGTPNDGSVFHCDDCIISKESEFELAASGSDILTLGNYNVIPNVIVRGVGSSVSSPSTGRTVSYSSPDTVTYTSAATKYVNDSTSLELTITLPALSGNSKYRIDQLGGKLMSSNAAAYAYLRITIQAASLFGGAETPIAEWSTHATDFETKNYTLPYLLQSAANEPVTLRYYLKTSNASYRAQAINFSYKYTEVLDSVEITTSSLSLYNTADTRRVLKCCNSLPQGYMVEIRADGTGSYRYSENFSDGAYVTNAKTITGSVVRNSTTKTLLMNAGSSVVFPFDTYYPVTGIPFIKMYVVSGMPQISIAEDSGGSPGTFYSVTGNISTAVANAEVERELDSASLRLRGKTKYYVKIEPVADESCEFGQMLEYATIDTMDADRFYIYATKKANTIGATVGEDGTGKCSMIVTLEIKDADIIP